MSKKTLTTQNVFRQCAVQKEMLPRKELFRLVRTKKGEVFFDSEYTIFGRGIHFSKNPEISAKFFDKRKRGMISHFLKTNITPGKFLELKNEVEQFLK